MGGGGGICSPPPPPEEVVKICRKLFTVPTFSSPFLRGIVGGIRDGGIGGAMWGGECLRGRGGCKRMNRMKEVEKGDLEYSGA